jgi:alkanesulfonate monooxygenase SsuD/methylene tetrahydromethanopterin reductase-like flavin-dependent oxidoreductase (luciferase family)
LIKKLNKPFDILIFAKEQIIEHLKLQQMRIVFMGTPDFAVASLAALIAAGFDVVGVVTLPTNLQEGVKN